MGKDGKLLYQPKMKLKDIATYVNGKAFKPSEWSDNGLPIIRIQNLTDSKKEFNYYDKDIDEKYIIEFGDILISWSATLGVFEWKRETAVLNQHIFKVVFDKKIKIDKKYFILAVQNILEHFERYVHGSTMKHITKKNFDNVELYFPTLTKQKKIAKVLDRANELITSRKESIEKLDELSKSIFIDMFGDPVLNSKGWEAIKLLKLGNCKNGLNYDSKENKYKIKCLGVGDFKNLTTIDDIESLQTITVDKKPAVDYLLQNKDLVFVRSNGNKKLVGRCIEVYPNEEKVTFSGFCIRFRLSSDLVKVSYLLNVLKCKSMRQKMSGRGANIQNLNQQILNGLDIPLPPITLQDKFANIIEEIEEQKALYEQQLKLLEDNFNSLLQRSFS